MPVTVLVGLLETTAVKVTNKAQKGKYTSQKKLGPTSIFPIDLIQKQPALSNLNFLLDLDFQTSKRMKLPMLCMP